MDTSRALTAFAALGHPVRLDAFRLLVQAGSDGMAAGDIAQALDAKANTASQNLSVLVQAGLLRNRREGRVIKYFADMEGVNALLHFLLEDCCGGAPDSCAPLIETLAPCCAPNATPNATQDR